MKIKVCLIQDNPVFFNKEKTIVKVEQLTKKYAKEGCELIVFPESFIPGYPRGFSFGTKIGSRTNEGRNLYSEYYRNSIDLESEDLKRLEKLSKSENVYLVIGATEKENTTVVYTVQCYTFHQQMDYWAYIEKLNQQAQKELYGVTQMENL